MIGQDFLPERVCGHLRSGPQCWRIGRAGTSSAPPAIGLKTLRFYIE